MRRAIRWRWGQPRHVLRACAGSLSPPRAPALAYTVDMWLASGLFLGAFVGVMVETLCATGASFLPGLGRRVWLGLRFAAAALLFVLGAIVLRAHTSTPVTPAVCTIIAPSIRPVSDDGDRYHQVDLLVRWTAGGRRLRLHEPLAYHRYAADEHPVSELERRFAPGTAIDCALQEKDPTRVVLMSADEWRADRSFAAATFFWAGAFALAGALIPLIRRRPADRPRPRRRGVTAVRLAWLAAGVVAFALQPAFGWLPIAGFLLLTVALLLLEVRSGERGLARVRAGLEEAAHWPDPTPSDGDGIDPFAEDRVTGLWRGVRVWVALTAGGPIVRVALARWPAAITASSEREAADLVTGDPDFDAAVSLRVPDDSWRLLLTSEVRRHLVALVGGRGGVIADSTLELHLADQRARSLPAVLDEATALAASLPDATDPRRALLAAIPAEPLAALRRGHYEHLLAVRHETPIVLRQAAADPDPAIASWARAQLPPDAGAYR